MVVRQDSCYWGHCKVIANYERALRIRLATIGENNPATAASYNNIGWTYHEKGDYDKAIANGETALRIELAPIGENNPTTGFSYRNIDSAYKGKGNYDKAIKNYERALRIQLAMIGEQSVHCSNASLHGIGLSRWIR